MDLGALIFPTDDTPNPVALARMAEDRGFESIWYPEHTHIPASRETPYPAGGELPREYSRILDPFVSLAAAASATSTIKLGTGICLVTEHDPIVLAKTVATLDQISGGRFLFGIGAGWNREEMRNHGTDPKTRIRLMTERVEAMKAIWTQEEASYAGEFVNFDRIWSWPKPLQEPHPPIYVGGHGANVFDRVVTLGDAWLPMLIGSDELIIGEVEKLRAHAGRDVPVTLYAGSSKPARLAGYAEAGIDRVVLLVPQGDGPAVEGRFDLLADRAREAVSGRSGRIGRRSRVRGVRLGASRVGTRIRASVDVAATQREDSHAGHGRAQVVGARGQDLSVPSRSRRRCRGRGRAGARRPARQRRRRHAVAHDDLLGRHQSRRAGR